MGSNHIYVSMFAKMSNLVNTISGECLAFLLYYTFAGAADLTRPQPDLPASCVN